MHSLSHRWTFATLVALALGGVAKGDDARAIPLTRRAPAVGDSYRGELHMTVRYGDAGHLKNGIGVDQVFTASLTGFDAASGKFKEAVNLEVEAETTETDGVASTTTREPHQMTVEATAAELSLVPLPSAKGAADDMAAGRDRLTVGETWTTEKKVALGGFTEVPVTGSYKVAGVEKDATGREVVRVKFACTGLGVVANAGTTVKVTGAGHALIDPERAERPVEVKLVYRFVAEGDGRDGPASESRSEILIRTTEIAKGKVTK